MRLKNFNLPFGVQVFKSLSDESRIRILHLLIHNKELCISDLEQILGFTQTKTSRHLTYLRNAGIVQARKVDQWVFYGIKEEGLDILNQIFNYLKKDSVLNEDMETYRALDSNRELAANRIETRKWTR